MHFCSSSTPFITRRSLQRKPCATKVQRKYRIMRRHAIGFRLFTIASLLATAGILSGCPSTSLSRAPVESRESGHTTTHRAPAPIQHSTNNHPIIVDSNGNVINTNHQAGTVQSYPVPAQNTTTHSSPYPSDNTGVVTNAVTDNQAMAGQPGYYTVRAGDNIYRIGLNNSQRWQDIATWNNLQEPYTISIGQVLRIAPLPGEAVVVTASPVTETTTEPATITDTSTSVTTTDSGSWIWPAKGKVISQFNGSTRKGINISGKRGEAVRASRAGTVVYAGEGLPGYGKLIILKHDETYLTAYAHNSKLLVRENQQISQGQQIAEMGKSDTDHVMLHFEVRKDGKPVNPMGYLKK